LSLSDAQLTGRDESHLHYRGGIALMPACWLAFEELRSAAAEAGFELCIASGFRSFDRQLAIWNAKALGERPVHDDSGHAVAMSELSPLQQVQAILRYSALPGASRHHWGTDLDVYDAAAMPEGYQLQLTPAEVADDGMFGGLHCWLDEQIAAGTAAGFFRPFAADKGGVAPERWHLSFAPLAQQCARHFTPACLREALETGGLEHSELVLSELPAIYERYVVVDTAA
jgi:LAS superfamily LD-carboxypeptidase LdcB